MAIWSTEDAITVQLGCDSVDNSNIVPYNAYLLKKYRSHINVEICSSGKNIKHLFSYVYKGHDYVSVEVRDNLVTDCEKNQAHNEITNDLVCCYVSHPEAFGHCQNSSYITHPTQSTDLQYILKTSKKFTFTEAMLSHRMTMTLSSLHDSN